MDQDCQLWLCLHASSATSFLPDKEAETWGETSLTYLRISTVLVSQQIAKYMLGSSLSHL